MCTCGQLNDVSLIIIYCFYADIPWVNINYLVLQCKRWDELVVVDNENMCLIKLERYILEWIGKWRLMKKEKEVKIGDIHTEEGKRKINKVVIKIVSGAQEILMVKW